MTTWILCAEKMPEVGEAVLIAWNGGEDGYDVAQWLGGGWYTCDGLDFDYGRGDGEVTHWADFDGLPRSTP